MKIISTKEYNKLKKTQSAYLELLMKPLQGAFEKVTDDDLLRENAIVYGENKELRKEIERLNNIIKELEKYLEKIKDRVIMYGIDDDTYKTTNLYRDIKNKIKELKGSDKE